MVDRCFRTRGVSPSFLSCVRSGRGAAVTKSDPGVTSPCVAKETEELRKREEVRQQGVTSQQNERSLSFYVQVSVAACSGFLPYVFQTHNTSVNQTRLIFSMRPRLMHHNTSFGVGFETRRRLGAACKQQLVGRMETSECKSTGTN